MNSSEQTSALVISLITATKKISAAKISIPENSFETLKNSKRDALINEAKSILLTESLVFEQVSGQARNGLMSLTTRLFHSPSGEWIEDISTLPPNFSESGASDNLEYLKNLSVASMLSI